MILVLGKARSFRTPNLGCRGSWVPWVIWYFAEKTLHEIRCMSGCVVVIHQLSIAAAFWLNFHGGMFQLNVEFDADSLLFLLNLNVMASLSSVYHPNWLVQWSHHCSCMRIPVHCPWLPGYINAAQTVLIVLTMVRKWRSQRTYIHDPWAWTKVGEWWWKGGTGQRGRKGRKKNNGWAFSGQTIHTYTQALTHKHTFYVNQLGVNSNILSLHSWLSIS